MIDYSAAISIINSLKKLIPSIQLFEISLLYYIYDNLVVGHYDGPVAQFFLFIGSNKWRTDQNKLLHCSDIETSVSEVEKARITSKLK